MGGRVGGISHKFYRETRGIKVSGGQVVKAGTILTRQGHKWRPGINVIGLNHLTANVEGEVYFTRKKSRFNKSITYINIKPVKIKAKVKSTAAASK
ncbi:MAG TPA: 50S ribosomal protein L27 [Candidatus Omnitrophota bacterium]|nr:50S ribosomal protein L27 [Candidatus Omnitrophota bacterium]